MWPIAHIKSENESPVYLAERARLIDALGMMTAGGIIENVQHIGSTSVPGLSVRGCLDIGLAVWPFPLPEEQTAALKTLGYRPLSEQNGEREQRFQRDHDACQLLFTNSGSDLWPNWLLLREHLRTSSAARSNYAEARQQANWTGSNRDFAPFVAAAHRWWIDHAGFGPLRAITNELADLSIPWFISSGWAIDLFLERVTRVHHDVDVAVRFGDQLILREYLAERDWQFVTPLSGVLEPWPPHMRITLPRHQVHGHRNGSFVDLLLTEMDDTIWQYRRNPVIMRNMERLALQSPDGIPFLAPEAVLLYKSKNTGHSGRDRIQDGEDFANVLPHLEPERRAWLRWALIATDPEHPWIGVLGA